MTNKSYYDDISLVEYTLALLKDIKDNNEIFYEAYNTVLDSLNDFKDIINDITTDKVLNDSYAKLTQDYISMENHYSKIKQSIDEYNKTCHGFLVLVGFRRRVYSAAFQILNSNSELYKSKVLFVGDNTLSASTVTYLKNLYAESKTIGFAMSVDDVFVLETVEEYISEY